MILLLIAFDQSNDESILEKVSLPSQMSITSDILCDSSSSSKQNSEIIFEEDETQESSVNDISEDDESPDNGEIDLVQEFELSQRQEPMKTDNLLTINDYDVYIIPEDDLISALSSKSTLRNSTEPISIMKIASTKTLDNNTDEQQQQTSNPLKPKVRFNLDPQYEREREWNKVNKLLGNSVEWTDEFEV